VPLTQHYTLTETAENDLLEARRWSEGRWGKRLTRQYFRELHEAANFCALNQQAIAQRDDLAGGSGLLIHPVREHYLIFLPTTCNHIIIVSVLRQGRDIPEILKRASFMLKREVDRITQLIGNGEITINHRAWKAPGKHASERK